MVVLRAFNWDSLTDSEWVKAVYEILQELPEPVPDNIDVRDWVFPDRAPVERMRLLLDYLHVPDTQHISDEFTRKVAQNLFSYFQRNSWEAVERTATDLDFSYRYNWRHGDRHGGGYKSVPNVTFSEPDAPRASATGTRSNDNAITFVVEEGGELYETPPAVTVRVFTAGGNDVTSSTIRANPTATVENGVVTAITGGQFQNIFGGYQIRVEVAGHPRATATATIENGAVTGYDLTSGGLGYLTPPTVTVDDPPLGTAINPIAIIAHGSVISLEDGIGIPDGRRTAIDFRVSPSPQINPDERYIRSLRQWLTWVLPYLEGEVNCVDGPEEEMIRPRIQVYLDTFAQLEINMRAGASVLVNVHRVGRPR